MWDVLRFEKDAIVLRNYDTGAELSCQVKDGNIVWAQESRRLPKDIRERIIMMAWQRRYLYCTEESCKYHKYSATKGVTHACGHHQWRNQVKQGNIQVEMGFWFGPKMVACSKYVNILDDKEGFR